MNLPDLFRRRQVQQLEQQNQQLLQRVQALEGRTPAVVISAAAQWASTVGFSSGNRDASLLRSVADASPIVRAAINAKKRHVSQLEYTVIGDNEAICAQLLNVLKRPYPGGTWRKFLGELIEDVLVIDAGAAYIWPTRGGDLYGLLPIDGNTIWPVPNDQGIQLDPPAIAYEQYISGSLTAQLTTHDLIYLVMNPRTHTLSGLSPVESVLHAVAVMLQRMTGISDESDNSNIPAFLGEVPEGMTSDQIKEWQQYWDAMTTGRKHWGMWGPHGSNVTFPPQRDVDVAFDEWLVKVVCAVMEIQPQEIGFTADVNRATGSSQEVIGQRRSVRPLALLIKEGIDHAFMASGYEGYELSWPTLDARDRSEIREDAKAFVPMGVAVPNDIREELGWKPLPGGDVPIVAQPAAASGAQSNDPNVARALSRAKRKALKVTPLDENDDALQAEAKLRTAIQAGFVQQHTAIEKRLQGIEVPGDLNILDDDAVEAWAAREMSERLGKRKVRRADGAADDDWESWLTPSLIEALKEIAQYGAQAGAGAISASVTVDWELANEDVARWARKYSSLLVGKINDTTWRGLKDSLAEWVVSKETYDQLVARFEGLLDDPKRADLVASTESTRAYAQGNRVLWQKTNEEYGLKIKRMWLTANDEAVCPICGGLDGQTVDLDEPFVLDGVEYDSQPAHPSCRCDGAAVV
ncbi:MAG: phage portal protein [Azonexus sp.]